MLYPGVCSACLSLLRKPWLWKVPKCVVCSPDIIVSLWEKLSQFQFQIPGCLYPHINSGMILLCTQESHVAVGRCLNSNKHTSSCFPPQGGGDPSSGPAVILWLPPAGSPAASWRSLGHSCAFPSWVLSGPDTGLHDPAVCGLKRYIFCSFPWPPSYSLNIQLWEEKSDKKEKYCILVTSWFHLTNIYYSPLCARHCSQPQGYKQKEYRVFPLFSTGQEQSGTTASLMGTL